MSRPSGARFDEGSGRGQSPKTYFVTIPYVQEYTFVVEAYDTEEAENEALRIAKDPGVAHITGPRYIAYDDINAVVKK